MKQYERKNEEVEQTDHVYKPLNLWRLSERCCLWIVSHWQQSLPFSFMLLGISRLLTLWLRCVAPLLDHCVFVWYPRFKDEHIWTYLTWHEISVMTSVDLGTRCYLYYMVLDGQMARWSHEHCCHETKDASSCEGVEISQPGELSIHISVRSKRRFANDFSVSPVNHPLIECYWVLESWGNVLSPALRDILVSALRAKNFRHSKFQLIPTNLTLNFGLNFQIGCKGPSTTAFCENPGGQFGLQCAKSELHRHTSVSVKYVTCIYTFAMHGYWCWYYMM